MNLKLAAPPEPAPKADDEVDLVKDGNRWTAVAKRVLKNGRTIEVKERVPLHVFKKSDKEKRSYFLVLSVQMRRQLDAIEERRPKPARHERRAHAKKLRTAIKKSKEKKPMSRVLNARLETLVAMANERSLPSYYQANAENYGFSNGILCAVATMQGVDYQPLRMPETWAGGVKAETAAKADEMVEKLTVDLESARHSLSVAINNVETLSAKLEKAEKRIKALGADTEPPTTFEAEALKAPTAVEIPLPPPPGISKNAAKDEASKPVTSKKASNVDAAKAKKKSSKA